MDVRTLFFLLPLVLFADSFITKDEYAKMLYKNPRGIGCDKCHGIDGKGLVLGKYRDGNKTIIIRTPDITRLKFRRFKNGITSKKNRLMPIYFLTDREIETLYYYLKKKHK